MKKLLLTAFVASMGLVAANAADVQVTSAITTTTTWTSDNVYYLNDVIFVKNGATLIIEPGTVIRGKTTGTSYDTTALWITRGSKIIAQGTKEAPIVMTDQFDTNVPSTPDAQRFASVNPYSTINPTASMPTKAKLWGGLVICGNAYATVDTSGSIVGPLVEDDMYAEGLSSSGDTQYGGADDDDNSGIVSYVSLRYGGYGFGSSSEINGISCMLSVVRQELIT